MCLNPVAVIELTDDGQLEVLADGMVYDPNTIGVIEYTEQSVAPDYPPFGKHRLNVSAETDTAIEARIGDGEVVIPGSAVAEIHDIERICS